MKAEFYYYKRKYTCCIVKTELSKELRIRNEEGEVIAIEQGKRFGFQGKKRESSKQVDVSQPYFYNLIKAAISALEIVEKNQLLLEKDQLIDVKDEKINILNQQLDIIDKNQILSDEQEQKLINLKNAIKEQESVIEVKNQHIAQLEDKLSQPPKILSFEEIEKEIRAKLGDEVWRCLHPSSHRDLCKAYRNYKLNKTEKFTAHVADYSDAGHLLGLVAEREIVAPFFRKLYEFLSNSNNQVNLSTGITFECGGVNLSSNSRYTLGNLRGLISNQWDTFTDNVLEQEDIISTTRLYRRVFCYNVSQADRQLIRQFLYQWRHPLSRWLTQGQVAASIIDQIRQLRNRASHAETTCNTIQVEAVLYLWQFKVLRALLIGSKTQRGVLQEIYGSSNTVQNNYYELTRGMQTSSPPSYSSVDNIRC